MSSFVMWILTSILCVYWLISLARTMSAIDVMKATHRAVTGTGSRRPHAAVWLKRIHERAMLIFGLAMFSLLVTSVVIMILVMAMVRSPGI